MKYLAVMLIGLFSVQMAGQKITHDLGNFTGIKVYDGVEVTLIKGDQNRAVITGSNRDEVEFKLDDGTLKIKMSIDNIWDDDDNTVVNLYYKKVDRIEAIQGTSVKVKDKMKQDRLHLETQEGADIFAEINVETLTSKCLTGGEIEVSGKADLQEVTIRAGGKYYAKNLNSNQVDISISAGGVADITAKKAVNAKVRAGGTVNVYGNPEVIDKNTLFGGNINRKN
ncbi:head GIN domain-containing protein [Salegentibacter chungangensis]|uniref:Head GIN domain-containing protein n=1 Tax=Salegentibacter chungangensis TaxID=1335724 RepID=A0ABW3NMY9_9FLAO